jgi:FkbM family methyltransferase
VVGVVLVFLINNWYRSTNVVIQNNSITNQQYPVKPPNGQNIPKGSTQIKAKPRKCGETDDDFKLSGIESVTSSFDRVSAKFRSKNASCKSKAFPKPSPQLTQEETQRKLECIKNWNRDYRKGSGAFWTGNTQYVRHTHHTYLSADSTVFDIGGNKGEDAEAMIKRFHPGNYVILEPIKTLYTNLVNMFKSNKNVTLYNFGLAKKYEKFFVNVLGHGGDATSVFAGNDNGGSCLLRVVNTKHFLVKVGVPCYEVDLITVNCEGCEFEIMEELISSGMIGQFRHIQFATHPTLKHLKQPIDRYCEIQEKLKRTHKVTYQYKWCWESWKRKDLA